MSAKMNKMNRSIFVFVLILFFACKQENDPALLLISPTYPTFNISGNQGIAFKINASSNCALKKLIIQSKKEFLPAETLLDSTLNSTTFQMDFDFIPTNPASNIEVKLTFILTDENSNQTTIEKQIQVSPNDEYLQETSGNEFYSAASHKQYTYDLNLLQAVFEPFTDSSTMHIQDYLTDTLHIATLSRTWHSPAGLKFVRFNDFDYTNATLQSARAAYDAGTKKPIVDNITSNDVLITKLNGTTLDNGYVVIKMIYVIDADSTFDDKYIFNVKK
jgi:hypothetical protein